MILSFERVSDYIYAKRKLLITLVAAFSLLTYLAASSRFYQIGFPLDDAWIHQTYARNLALHGEWSFVPGQPSAGSTSPMWTGLLAPGYWLGISPFFWTFFLGWLMLTMLGLTGMRFSRRIFPFHPICEVAAGLILVTEWHLVWAAASGMETLLFALLILLVLDGLLSEKPSWLVEGLLVGASIWIRPDGVTLAGPVLFIIFLRQPSWKTRLGAGLKLLAGMLALAIPYLFFNVALSGAWWPNTFFAKQAEYAVYRQMPIFVRFVQEAGLMLIGVGAILLPGLPILLLRSIRRRDWEILACMIWLVGFVFIYAFRLPVTYQHGRYIIPAMPVYFLLAFFGMISWFKVREPAFRRRIIGRVWVVSCGAVLWGFLILGARTYAKDVALIDSEMVVTSRWISENTEPDAVIAAHDIGALGFFGNRSILDLAGLVTPEVIPFIRDESRIAVFMDEYGADHLMSFPGWYPELIKLGSPLYCTEGNISPTQGGENMCVYRWR
jgi:hypothetical protein